MRDRMGQAARALFPPSDAGTVLVNGAPVAFRSPSDAIRAGIGMVHQEFTLIPGLTLLENLILCAEPRRGLGAIDLREAEARAFALAELARLMTGEPVETPTAKPAQPGAPVLELDRIGAGGEGAVALMDFSLTLRAGEIVGIAGGRGQRPG